MTSWALLLAAGWPREACDLRVVLEADCSGGVLGARYQLGVEPGAMSLMSACRRRDVEVDPADHGRLLDDGLWAIPGPETAEQAVPAWRAGVADVAATLATDHRLWVVDLGRSEPTSPVRALAERASLNVVMTRGSIEDIAQLPARVAALDEAAPTFVIIVGKSGFGENDLHDYLGGRRLWLVPSPADLPRLTMRAVQGGRARRSQLWRAATKVADDLVQFSQRVSGATAPPEPPIRPPIKPPKFPEPSSSTNVRSATAVESQVIGGADDG